VAELIEDKKNVFFLLDDLVHIWLSLTWKRGQRAYHVF